MRWLVLFTVVSQLSACISLPDIYLIDRPTVMEAEASGEWPQLERRFRQQVPSMGPTNLAKEPSQKRREHAFQLLNGEFPAIPSDTERQVR